jgi:hypothetical protein
MNYIINKTNKIKELVEVMKIYQRLTHHRWYLYGLALFASMCIACMIWVTCNIVIDAGLMIFLKTSADLGILFFAMMCLMASALFLVCMYILIYSDAEAMRIDDRDDIKLIGIKYGYTSKVNEYGYTD